MNDALRRTVSLALTGTIAICLLLAASLRSLVSRAAFFTSQHCCRVSGSVWTLP